MRNEEDSNQQLLTIFEGFGGESGIRPHVRVSPKHAFQACAFSHSAISPHHGSDLIIAKIATCGQTQSRSPKATAEFSPEASGVMEGNRRARNPNVHHPLQKNVLLFPARKSRSIQEETFWCTQGKSLPSPSATSAAPAPPPPPQSVSVPREANKRLFRNTR